MLYHYTADEFCTLLPVSYADAENIIGSVDDIKALWLKQTLLDLAGELISGGLRPDQVSSILKYASKISRQILDK